MTNKTEKEQFLKLIDKYLEGKTSLEELKLLLNYYESFQKKNDWVEALGTEKSIKNKMLKSILDSLKDEKTKKPIIISLIKSNVFRYSVAATVLSFVLLNLFTKKPSSFENEGVLSQNKSIQIAAEKSFLTLNNGTEISLDNIQNYEGETLSISGKEIIYKTIKSNAKDVPYNYLTISRGEQFSLKLSDGTQVWLNSETKLKYPVSFINGEDRKVELVYGEAYFDVSPSTEHKGSRFKVFNQFQEIEVLGTEFNIKAYKDESKIFTTLVEGKVSIDVNGKKQNLIPSEQSVLNIKNSDININKVNVYNELSWKEGVFIFKDKSLYEIMKVISRWYDIDFVFEDKELENLTFNGKLLKSQTLEEILNFIKLNNIEFEIIDKMIIFK
jgi:transmembrane sensor